MDISEKFVQLLSSNGELFITRNDFCLAQLLTEKYGQIKKSIDELTQTHSEKIRTPFVSSENKYYHIGNERFDATERLFCGNYNTHDTSS